MDQSAHTTGNSLTNINRIGRKAVVWVVASLLILIVGRMALEAGIAYYKAVNPPPPPEPTVGFGILPSVDFPTQSSELKPSSYILETANGRLPGFPDRAKVYFLPRATASLLADQKAKDLASRYGFVFQPEILDERTYRWTQNTDSLISILELDINQLNMTYSTDYLSRPELIVNRNLPTNFDAVESVKSFLSRGGLLPQDAATASGEVRYMKTLGGELVEAVSLSDADYLAVDLNRTPIDNQYEMYTQDGKTGTITAVVSGSGGRTQGIMQLDIHHYLPDYTQAHTYPLRPVADAWRLLQAGEGYIPNPTTDAVTIRSVELGYYDPTTTYLPYLQPIYVFIGDNDFYGYIPAIESRYLE